MDCRNLLSYRGTHKLYDQLVKYPQEVIPLMDHTIKAYYLELFPEDEMVEQIKVNKMGKKGKNYCEHYKCNSLGNGVFTYIWN